MHARVHVRAIVRVRSLVGRPIAGAAILSEHGWLRGGWGGWKGDGWREEDEEEEEEDR